MAYTTNTHPVDAFVKGRGIYNVESVNILPWDASDIKGALNKYASSKKASTHYVVGDGVVDAFVPESDTAFAGKNWQTNRTGIDVRVNPESSDGERRTLDELVKTIKRNYNYDLVVNDPGNLLVNIPKVEDKEVKK